MASPLASTTVRFSMVKSRASVISSPSPPPDLPANESLVSPFPAPEILKSILPTTERVDVKLKVPAPNLTVGQSLLIRISWISAWVMSGVIVHFGGSEHPFSSSSHDEVATSKPAMRIVPTRWYVKNGGFLSDRAAVGHEGLVALLIYILFRIDGAFGGSAASPLS